MNRQWNKSLAVLLSASMITIDALPVFAEGETENTVSIQENSNEEEIQETDGESVEQKAEDVEDGISGYYEIPGEEDVPVLDTDLDFYSLRSGLVDGCDGDMQLLMSAPGTSASVSDRAFPYAHDGNWLAYFQEHYPATRNQSPYGSCWAHSAMSLAEFYLIKHGMAGKNIDLSELHLAYWCYTDGAPSVAGDTGDSVSVASSGNKLDNGGNVSTAAQSLFHQRGFASESTAPYSDAQRIAKGGSLDADTEFEDVYYLKNAYAVNMQNRDLVKGAILENGAVGTAIYAFTGYYKDATNAYYGSKANSTNHAITIVGWDDDFPASDFKPCNDKLPEHDGAWLVRNSWSTKAEASYESYFWLAYEDASISNLAWSYEVTTTFPYDNHYYYDGAVHFYAFRKGAVCANMYTVAGKEEAVKERLEAVTFEVAAAGTQPSGYTIQIYRNVKGDTPTSGTLVEEAVTTGEIAFRGEYTIPLKEPVLLKQGERFAVVVTLDSSDYAITQERAISEGRFGSTTTKVGSEPGQSCYSSNGTKWISTGTGGNYVISALTTDVDDGTAHLKQGDDGQLHVYQYKKENSAYSGMALYKGSLFYMANGVIATQANGLMQDPNHPEDWYFCANGQVQSGYTGLAEYDGEWFYIEEGLLNTTLAAYVPYDGGLFYVAAGRILREVNGLAQDPDGSDWYYLAEGQAQTQYTGLAEYDGEWFYVVRGKLAEYYTGPVSYDGNEFWVENGQLH